MFTPYYHVHTILCCAMASRDPKRKRAYLDMLLGARVAGCILTVSVQDTTYFERFYQRHRLPMVLVDKVTSSVLDSVPVDNYAGTLHAIAHLVSRAEDPEDQDPGGG